MLRAQPHSTHATRSPGSSAPMPQRLADVLQVMARRLPDERAFVYIDEHASEDASSHEAQVTLTYAQLDRRAQAIAARLRDVGAAGSRVILAYPPGLDFVEGLYGCLYAGCVAVPTNLAHRRRPLSRFDAVLADAEAAHGLTTAATARRFNKRSRSRKNTSDDAEYSQVKWLATDEVGDEWAQRWSVRDTDAVDARDELAMLQYTSGSTSSPKGVMLTHANLMHNVVAIADAFRVGDSDATAVFWLPTYHDMGLIGGVLAPVYTGITNIMLSPATFLQNPIRWLEAISEHGASVSGGPNFAYDICVRKISEQQRRGLDLSSWSLAFVGAEPIQPETLERFAAAFAPCGFDARAFYPCYGLAEATLMVTGPPRGRGVIARDFDDAALSENRAEELSGTDSQGPRSVRLAACGAPVGDMRIAIVDPGTQKELEPGRVGEICVAGGSVGQGYWRKPNQTERAFKAHLRDTGEGPFLRTGDLGFMLDGELYVTGRRDDLIIVRGINRYPQDVEATARRSHPSLDSLRGAAFAVNGSPDERERLVLVHEISTGSRNRKTDYASIIDAMSEAVLEEHDLGLDEIVLVRGGTIPRTSSGKTRRRACRDAFLAGELRVLAHRPLSDGVSHNGEQRAQAPQPSRAATRAASPEATAFDEVFDVVCRHVRSVRRSSQQAADELTPRTRLTALGLDSLQRVELAAALEKTFGGRLPNTSDIRTLGELAGAVQRHLLDRNDTERSARTEGEIPREHYDIAHFPEWRELDEHRRSLADAGGDTLYFRVDAGLAESDAAAVNFCSYDYLGMSRDPHIHAAAKAAIDRYGTSAGASRLVSGEKQVHRDLEERLASFLGADDAVAFVSGHATNVTTIGHLLGADDLIVYDELAHNSIIQGAHLSGASHRSFSHNDSAELDALLRDVRREYRRVLIAIEGIYSMDGDWPDLPRFVELKRKHKALLLVDEAHSLGTMGETGRGIAEHAGVDRGDVDIWMGTLSKALASCGGYVAGSRELVAYLKYTAPGFVYSVGMSPANAAAALASLQVLEEQPQRVAKLRELSELFLELARERGLNTGLAAGSPVVPVIIGNSAESLRVSRRLLDRGISVQPILHPAVPEQSARLRFFITVNHSREQVRAAVEAVAEEVAAVEPKPR